MAKVNLIIEDNLDGTIRMEIIASEGFPPQTKDWTDAQQAGMYAYHLLGTPAQDLRTTEVESTDVGPGVHNIDCNSENNLGPCDCPARDL